MIMSKKFEDFNNPREKALQGLKDSIPASPWEENLQQLRPAKREGQFHRGHDRGYDYGRLSSPHDRDHRPLQVQEV